MSAILCPHCGSTISVVGFAPGQLVACGHCGNTLQVPAAETPLASPAAPQARPAPRGAPPPLPHAATSGYSQPGAAPSGPMQPVPYAPQPAAAEPPKSSASTYVPPRRKRGSPLTTMILVVLVTVVLVGGGLGIGGYFLSQTELPQDESTAQQRQPIVIKKHVGGRVRLESSDYKPKGPQLSITRSQFRDQVEALPYSYNSSTAQRHFHSGQSFVDAFGRPHRVRHLDDEVHYYWNCSDGTLKVVCPNSEFSLENRNSADGSALIVYRIDNEFY